MLLWTILIVVFVSCSADLPHIEVGTKIQPNKGLALVTYIKFHFVLRCPPIPLYARRGRQFEYKISLIESDTGIDDYLESSHGHAINETYGLIDTWDTTDLSENFEFTIRISHNCRRDGTDEDEWKEVMRCPTHNLQCQFFFDVDLVNLVDMRPKCNEGGYCDVVVQHDPIV